MALPDDAPELVIVCDACRAELAVPEGLHAFDLLWLHERRCTPRVPCPACLAEVAIPTGMSAVEALWLHEEDCAAPDEPSFTWTEATLP